MQYVIVYMFPVPFSLPLLSSSIPPSLPPTTVSPPPPALVGMLHLGIFILLLLSGERNFGVRLNKPFTKKLQLPDVPKFTGSHADLLFLVRRERWREGGREGGREGLCVCSTLLMRMVHSHGIQVQCR